MERFAVAAAKAFVAKDGKILILRESSAYKGGSQHGRYVLPGGKVDEGEPFKYALKRELREECDIEVEVGQVFHVNEWFINIPNKPKHIVGMFFECTHTGGELNVCDEFDHFEWIDPVRYRDYDINDAAQEAFAAYLHIKL